MGTPTKKPRGTEEQQKRDEKSQEDKKDAVSAF